MSPEILLPPQLVNVIVEETGANPLRIRAETRLEELLEDSLEFLSLVAAIDRVCGRCRPEPRRASKPWATSYCCCRRRCDAH